jgi:hypothetical protein
MHIASEKGQNKFFLVTLLGCSHPSAGDAEQVGFAGGCAGHLPPQTDSLCPWWLQKAAKLQEHVKTSKKKE